MEGKVFRNAAAFGWLNYTVFGATLATFLFIGVCVGCFGKKQTTMEEYMFGGRTIHFLLIAVSFIASHISAVTLIGVPTEVYLYGTLYWLMCPAMIVVGFITIRVFVPVYWSLKITIVQQYLELRFNKRVRLMGTVLYLINTMLFLPILIYGPSLAFSQVSGVNVHIICVTVGAVCTLYTMLGGLRGIVLTDSLQAFIMVGSCLTWIAMGTWNAGGVGKVWSRALQAGRIRIFEMDPDPFRARTFWTMTLGSVGLWTANCATNPLMVQRFVAVSSPRKCKKSVTLFCVGMVTVVSMSCYTGLIIYSLYGDCDPVSSGAISKYDQLVPYFVMDTVGHIPGLAGLFIAAIFSASLSSLSGATNTLSGIIYEEFMTKIIRTPAKYNPHVYIKFGIIVIGVFSILMTFVIEKLGQIVEVTLSINGVTSGALLGLYTLGMICPWASPKGVVSGVISSLVLLMCISGGAHYSKFANNAVLAGLNITTHGCNGSSVATANMTVPRSSSEWPKNTFILFRLSFVYYTLLGALTVIAIGVITSYACGPTNPNSLDPAMIAPPFHFLLPRKPRDRGAVMKLLKADESVNGRACKEATFSCIRSPACRSIVADR